MMRISASFGFGLTSLFISFVSSTVGVAVVSV